MKGCVCRRNDLKNPWFYVAWYQDGKEHRINHYLNGERMTKETAHKLLAMMQGDYERGVFNLERYLHNTSEVATALEEWLDQIEGTVSPGTYSNYKGYVNNHLIPFFTKHPVMIHEVKLSVLTMLLKSINLKPKGKWNVMQCFHVFMDFMCRDGRIIAVPPFPKKKAFGLVEKEIKWLPSDRQMAVIGMIPKEHQPIFLFLKYHMRRPSEAMMLHKADYDPRDKVFTIHRGISNGQEVEHTKTNAIHYIPCHSEFQTILEGMPWDYPFSPFLFTCHESNHKDKRYTRNILQRLWKEACIKAGEDIPLYDGLKHSTVCQFLNEKGYSFVEVQVITDHKSLESVKRYGKIEVARKRALLEGKVVKLRSGGNPGVDATEISSIKSGS